MSASSHGPLSGLVVLDLATIFAGPAACRHLADFGADVIKVERPHAGDGARHLGECDGEDSFYWRQVGRNKRPIEIDLKSPQGREVLLRLVRGADVLVENFRPGALERLGLDPETVLLAENPGLVVLRVTGYGQTGPYADRAGFGTMAEGMSTLAHTTGQPDGPAHPAADRPGRRGDRHARRVRRAGSAPPPRPDRRRPGDRHQPARVAGGHGRTGAGHLPPHRPVGRSHRLAAVLLGAAQHLPVPGRLHRAVRVGQPGRAAGVRRDRPQRPAHRPPLHDGSGPHRARRTAGRDHHGVDGAAYGRAGDRDDRRRRRRRGAGLRRGGAGARPPRAGAGLFRGGREPGRQRPDPAAGRAPAHVTDAGWDPPRRPRAGSQHRRGAGRGRLRRRADRGPAGAGRCGRRGGAGRRRAPRGWPPPPRARSRPARPHRRRWCGS